LPPETTRHQALIRQVPVGHTSSTVRRVIDRGASARVAACIPTTVRILYI
jgi:hypothetical protein